MRRFCLEFGLLLLAPPVWAGTAPLPVGGEFQVNTYTTSGQYRPSVSLDADGDFVVVWESIGSSGSDSAGYSIQGQRYAAGGAALGGQFQVNSYTTLNQRAPTVARDAHGDFVVVFSSNGSNGDDTSLHSIQGRRYAAAGTAQGEQFQINAYTTDNQQSAVVSVNADGDFVVVWHSLGSSAGDNSLHSIQGQRFAAGGAALGGEFQVNTFTTGYQVAPAVALDAVGDFVVVWHSAGSSGGDTSFYSVQGQRYAAGGAALGGEFQVNSYITSNQFYPAVSAASDGDFVVIWDSDGSSGGDTSLESVQGQRYTAGGAALGGEFQVNSYTTNGQGGNSVSRDADGDFVVVWHGGGSSGADSAGYSIHGQRYTAGGAALGGEFQINSYTTNNQAVAEVSLSADGDFVVVWTSGGSSGGDTDGYSIQGQRYRVTGDLVGKVFFDDNADGLQTGAEPGVGGVVVELYDDSLVLRRTAVTDEIGEYHLRPKEGSWHLRFVAPPSYFTIPNVGGDDTADSDAIPATGETAPFSVTVNVLDSTVDAGFVVSLIFWDGFGSENTEAWSATVP